MKVKCIKINANKPKVGQKYRSYDAIFMIADINGKYTLVCIEDNQDIELGCSYDHRLHDKIDDVFGEHRKYFTLLK